MKLNNLIHTKHFNWCPANRKHYKNFSYHVIILSLLLLLLQLLWPLLVLPMLFSLLQLLLFKKNKQARAPFLMGPFSKENNTCQPDLGEVEGQRSMQITPERFLIRCHVSLALFHYHSGPKRPIPSPSAATPRPILATMKTTSSYLLDSNFL